MFIQLSMCGLLLLIMIGKEKRVLQDSYTAFIILNDLIGKSKAYYSHRNSLVNIHVHFISFLFFY